MALFHFHVTQIKRSAGQSAVASAAYRAGEKLHSEYYGEDSDYTKKKGVITADILLPSHSPPEYSDRENLWNAVEKAEHGKNAQLAYSFDIALQNEFSLDENIALTRQFLSEQFVSRGMIVDFAIHQPEKDGISNPHFHVMCPIRPLKEDGTWDAKQHREYLFDEAGNPILDDAGHQKFNAVPTTDWGTPETLDAWRKAWADLCNAKFAEKNLDCRIDHRSYEKQGVDLIPTVHEGPAVREMEKRGIRTDKGDHNRLIRQINAALKDLKSKLKALVAWIADLKEELSKPPEPTVYDLLNIALQRRNEGAWSFVAKSKNLQNSSKLVAYLQQHGTHEQIIKDDVFEKVQEIRQQRHRMTRTGRSSIFSGLVYCADCGAKMQYGSSNNYDTKQDFFDCSVHWKDKEKCNGHFIRVAVLDRMVLKHVQAVTDYILYHEAHFRRTMMEQTLAESREKIL